MPQFTIEQHLFRRFNPVYLRRMMRHRSSILIRDLDMNPLFRIDFYGVDTSELCATGGGNIVATALERRGIDPHSVIFTLWDIDV